MRRACDVLTPEYEQRGPPPPAPYSSALPRKGRGQRGDSERTWGGGRGQTETPGGETRGEQKKTEKNKKQTTKHTSAPEQGQTAGADGTWREPGSTARGAGSWGRKLGGRDQRRDEGGAGQGDKSPQKTLVRYPTLGVWGPPRCPYRPHPSAGNKEGYARDRWPAARGGTGLGGWPIGLTRSTLHGTYCGSCPVRGCG